MDGEYFSPEDAFTGQIRVGVGENDIACFTESNLLADEIIDIAAREGNPKPGLVCDLDGEKDVSADLIRALYADGYTLVICVNRDGEIKDGESKTEDCKPERNGILGR